MSQCPCCKCRSAKIGHMKYCMQEEIWACQLPSPTYVHVNVGVHQLDIYFLKEIQGLSELWTIHDETWVHAKRHLWCIWNIGKLALNEMFFKYYWYVKIIFFQTRRVIIYILQWCLLIFFLSAAISWPCTKHRSVEANQGNNISSSTIFSLFLTELCMSHVCIPWGK